VIDTRSSFILVSYMAVGIPTLRNRKMMKSTTERHAIDLSSVMR
jgi:hypothetical protein